MVTQAGLLVLHIVRSMFQTTQLLYIKLKKCDFLGKSLKNPSHYKRRSNHKCSGNLFLFLTFNPKLYFEIKYLSTGDFVAFASVSLTEAIILRCLERLNSIK